MQKKTSILLKKSDDVRLHVAGTSEPKSVQQVKQGA